MEERLRLLIPWEKLEVGAQDQLKKVLSYWFVEAVAAMPDMHQGYDMPIGGVARTNGVICPAWVGYDIACGMCCVDTGVSAKGLRRHANKLHTRIGEVIPLGLGGMRAREEEYPEFKSACVSRSATQTIMAKLRFQLGTLGAGNHFIEVGESEKNGTIVVTVHSGSRGAGWLIAHYYMKMAHKEDPSLPKGFFHLDSEWGQSYLVDMEFAMEYALASRKLMLEQTLTEIRRFTHFSINKALEGLINEHHNYAFVHGDKVIHRKGATPAEKGQLGVIPISPNEGVYITRGLGNEEFLCSASHGAGRKMSRSQAKKSISLDRMRESMKGIACRVDKGVLDEAPDAYKKVEDIIPPQDGVVVEVLDKTNPFVVAKG